MTVDDELERFAREGAARAGRYGDDYACLWTALGGVTGAGKRFRSRLLLAAYRSSDRPAIAGPEVAVKVAAAVEMLHAAFLVHDDVIDRDLLRRGSPNVAGTFVDRARACGLADEGSGTLGLTAGVLAGDLALVGATREVALCGADPATTRRLLDLFSDAVEVSAAGELADVSLGVGARRTWTLADVITTGEHKTAVYSFQLPLQAGAVLGGTDDETVGRLGTVGRLAGVGFQLVDDLRGVFGDEADTGKCALGDLREGKITAIVAHACGTDAWPQISQYVGDPDLDDEGAAIARKLLEECGSRAFVEDLADSYLAAALRTARDADLAPALLDELTELCRRIMLSAA